MKRITAVIPTMLKNLNILTGLIDNLAADLSVEEIIIINNSNEKFSYNNPKVRIISKNKNLYVNPSWNLGVSEAKTEYITLVNDDIIIPPNFCSDVLEKFDENIGIAGIDGRYVRNIHNCEGDIDIIQRELGNMNEIVLFPVSYRTKNFGVMMFFNKKIYKPIPEDLKIFFGDDYLVYFAKKRKRQNVVIAGKEVFHVGSLTSKIFKDVALKENITWKKYIFPWYKRILYLYERDTHYVLNILFMQFSIKKSCEI